MVSRMRSNALSGTDENRPRVAERRTERYNVRLTPAASEALKEQARELDAPPTTLAAQIIEDAVAPNLPTIARRRPAPNKK
jgi:hypothetical protein